MHIAFLTAEYPPQPGGVGDYTRCLALALAASGHTVSVVTGNGESTADSSGTDDVPTRRVITSWGWHCWQETIAAIDLLRPDVLHIQYQTGAYGMQPAVNLLPWRLGSLPRRPHIAVTYHDLLVPYLFAKAGALRTWITLRLGHNADIVIATNSDDAAQLATAGITAPVIPIGSNIAVAPPPGYQREAWRAQTGVAPTDTLVAYFGLLSRSKGVDVLLNALHLLHHERDPSTRYVLLIIGGAATTPQDRAYADEITAQIERLGLSHLVTITGHVDEASVSAHLLAADCVVLPFRGGASFRSGSLLAALTHGLPVVTTRGASTTLTDGENVLLVPPEDSVTLADALQRLAQDRALRARLAAGATALGASVQWAEIAQEHVRRYQAALSGC